MKNIFVGNIDFNTTEDSLRELFAAYGPVNQVTIVRDRDTGQPRGFAFVEMASVGDADKAIAEVNGRQFGGRTLNVNEARPKPQREGSWGGREHRKKGGRW
jgi:cold-inducible RNA-binding protein